MPSKTKTKKQVRYLLSKGSPLSSKQKSKLQTELRQRVVKVKGNVRKQRQRKKGRK